MDDLIRSPKFFEEVAARTPGMVVVYNIQTGVYIYVNDSSRKVLGYAPQTFIKGGAQFATSLVHPDDLPGILRENGQALRRGNIKKYAKEVDSRIFQFTYRMRHKDGTFRWFQTDASVFSRDKKGHIEYVLNISVDITERIRTETELIEASAQLESAVKRQSSEFSHIAESITEGFLTYDNDMRYTYVNKSAQKMLGMTYHELLGKTPMDLYPGYADMEIYKKNVEALTTKKPIHYEYFSDRFQVWFEVRHYPRPDGLSIFFSDVTERKSLEEKKDEFIGIASHELKTPLTSIKGYTQILERIIRRSKDKRAVAYINKQKIYIERLNNLIADLLDVSKIQAGRLQFNFSRFEFDSMVEDAVEAARSMTNSHKIVVRGHANQKIRGDRERLEQVIVNLLTNAVKYSPGADQVIVRVGKNKKEIVVSVRDFGVGILKGEQHKLFERFYRGESAAKRFSGLGIGLYISSEIIQRHRGRIWVKSRRGHGSTFSFSLAYHVQVRSA